MRVSGPGGFCSRPVLPETIVITVPFEPRGFLKVICSMLIGSFYVLLCVSLCYVLYPILITFVDKTTVNAQSLSPPTFEKIAPHFENNVFS